MQSFCSSVLFYFFLSPILYYTNVWYSAYISGHPKWTVIANDLVSRSSHRAHSTTQGKSYNISRVMDASLNFVESKYKEYSPMYISMSYSLTYGLSFAAVTAVVVHTYLYNGSEIWARLKNARQGAKHIHRPGGGL